MTSSKTSSDCISTTSITSTNNNFTLHQTCKFANQHYLYQTRCSIFPHLLYFPSPHIYFHQTLGLHTLSIPSFQFQHIAVTGRLQLFGTSPHHPCFLLAAPQQHRHPKAVFFSPSFPAEMISLPFPQDKTTSPLHIPTPSHFFHSQLSSQTSQFSLHTSK